MITLGALIQIYPKTYAASSSVIFQGDYPANDHDEQAREPAFAPDTLSNEVELITSEELLGKVASSIGLSHDPDFAPAQGQNAPAWQPSWLHFGQASSASPQDGSGPPSAQTIDRLRHSLTVVPIGLSRVIRITAKLNSPILASTVANAVASAYVEDRAATKLAAIQEGHDWLEKSLGLLRDRARVAAQTYDNFRHDAGAVSGKDSTISQEQLTQISGELTQTRQLIATTQLTLAQTNGGSDSDLDALTSASGDQLLPKLREQLAAATAKKAQLDVIGGSALPRIVANRAEVADITRSIARERLSIRRALQGKLKVLQGDELQLDAAFKSMQSKVEVADRSGAEMQALEREAAVDAELYRNFAARAEQTDPILNYQPPSVRVLSRATPPITAASPNKKTMLPAAFLISLGLGVAAAFVRENTRRGIFSLQELPRPEGQTPIGFLPFVPASDHKMVKVWDEAINQCLARMLLPVQGIVPASVIVTSALPQEGKTRIAITLAKAATARGLRVLLIDADLRSQALSKLAGLNDCDLNLLRLLRAEIDVAEAFVDHLQWGFAVLPAGRLAESPMTLLTSDAWEGALRDLEGFFDLVIIDTPPVLVAGDAWVLARHADATAMVTQWGATSSAVVMQAIERLMTAHARVLGIIMTKVAHREHAKSGYDDSVIFSPQLLRYHSRRRLS